MSRTRSSGTSASSMTTSEPPLAWSIVSTMPTPNRAKRSRRSIMTVWTVGSPSSLRSLGLRSLSPPATSDTTWSSGMRFWPA